MGIGILCHSPNPLPVHCTISVATGATSLPTLHTLLWVAPPSPQGPAKLPRGVKPQPPRPPGPCIPALRPQFDLLCGCCRCVLCSRNSSAPGSLQALPFLRPETLPPHRLQGSQARAEGRAQFSTALPPLPEQSQVGPALLAMSALQWMEVRVWAEEGMKEGQLHERLRQLDPSMCFSSLEFIGMKGSSQPEMVPNPIYPGPNPCLLMQGDDFTVTDSILT